MEIKRTFAAVKIIPEQRLTGLLSEIRSRFKRDDIKWVDPNSMHLTLKFFGDTTPDQLSKISVFLENICRKHMQFEFNIFGVGFFKRNGQPNVLLSNIGACTALSEIAGEIDREAEKLGFEREQRDFKPHLTLGRIKYISNKIELYKLVDENENNDIQTVRAENVILFESILKPGGPLYFPIRTFQLNHPV